LLLASGPFLRRAVSEARERRPRLILLVGMAMTVGVLALVASLFFTGCGC
jgi:hypothetical protein